MKTLVIGMKLIFFVAWNIILRVYVNFLLSTGSGEKVDTFPKKSINPKVNVIAGVDLEILYYDVQV